MVPRPSVQTVPKRGPTVGLEMGLIATVGMAEMSVSIYQLRSELRSRSNSSFSKRSRTQRWKRQVR